MLKIGCSETKVTDLPPLFLIIAYCRLKVLPPCGAASQLRQRRVPYYRENTQAAALLENDSSITGTMCASVKARYRGNNGGQGMSRTRTNFCGWGQEGPLVEYP